MQNSAWKLTALAGVVALGFFAVVQTQRGLLDESPAENGDDTAAKADAKDHLPVLSTPGGNGNGVMLAQYEPDGKGGDPFTGDTPKAGSSVAPTGGTGGTSNSGGPFGTGVADKKPSGGDTIGAFPEFDDKKSKPSTPSPDNKTGLESPKLLFGGSADDAKGDSTKTPPAKIDDSAKATPPAGGELKKVAAESPFGSGDAGKTDAAKSPPKSADNRASESNSPAAKLFGTLGPTPKPPTPKPPAPKTDGGGNPLPGSSDSGGGETTKPPAPPVFNLTPKPETSAKTSDAVKPDVASPPAKVDSASKETPIPPTPLFGGPDVKTPPAKTVPLAPPAKPLPVETKPLPVKPTPTATKTVPDATPRRLLPSSNATPLVPAPATSGANTTRLGNYQVIPQGDSRPQLSISKQAPSNAILGKPFVYDIVIKNTGNSAAGQVVVEDPVPRGVRLEGTDPQAVLSKSKLIWKLGSIAPGKTMRISVKVTPLRAGQIGSVATVNFVSTVAARTTIEAPKLSLDFRGPGTGSIGQKVTFQFKVTNNGTTEAKDVWIRDIVPDGLKHPGGDDLEYNVGTLPPGKSEVVTLNMTVVKSGRLTNRAIVSAAGGIRIESKVALNVAAPKLFITRAGPRKRYVGVQALYQNMVTNKSAETVDGTIVTEAVPPGMDFVQASDGGKYDPQTRVVTWVVGKLAPRQSRTVKLVLLPKQTGVKNSVVQASAGGQGVVKTASATKIEGYAALGVDVPAIERPVSVGEQVSFRVVGRNRGTLSSKNVRLQVTLPAQLNLVAIRGRGKYARQGQTIVFEPVGSLGVNEKIAFDLVLQPVAEGDLRVKVQIQSDEMSKPLTREEAVRVLAN